MSRIIVLVMAAASMLWSLAVWLVGGFRLPLGAGVLSSTDPWRPFGIAAICLAIYAVLAGPDRVRKDLAASRRFSTAIAVLVALCPAVAGIARNSWTAGGSDSYAYVAQADLWLQGTQSVPAPIADAVPWPDPLWTFSPFGFRPAAGAVALVPMTAPGLSLMMAAAKAIAGHCAMFWVVPICGAFVVWTTFLIGRRLRSEGVGLGAAWLMATSPAFLAMLVSPMSDVPATMFWAIAIYYTLETSPRSAVAAGLAASAAILVRPNLAPLAGVLFAGRFLPHLSHLSHRAHRAHLLFLVALIPGCLLVGWFNNALYGSPLASGYGDLSYLFSMKNIVPNLARYGSWFVQSQTPLAVLGLIGLLFQSLLLAAFALAVLILYIAYVPFDAWWYLRFLLPAWPAISVGTAALILQRAPGRLQLAGARVALLIALGSHGIFFAATHGAFPTGEGDHRYASVAKLVEQVTEPSSVIIAGQNSGAMRYYGGRITVRFEALGEEWLDRAVAWLGNEGRHPYFLLEEWELPIFQARFSKRNRLGSLPLTPVLAYQGPGVPGQVYLFDPTRPDGPTRRLLPPPSAQARCVEPVRPVMLHLR